MLLASAAVPSKNRDGIASRIWGNRTVKAAAQHALHDPRSIPWRPSVLQVLRQYFGVDEDSIEEVRSVHSRLEHALHVHVCQSLSQTTLETVADSRVV